MSRLASKSLQEKTSIYGESEGTANPILPWKSRQGRTKESKSNPREYIPINMRSWVKGTKDASSWKAVEHDGTGRIIRAKGVGKGCGSSRLDKRERWKRRKIRE